MKSLTLTGSRGETGYPEDITPQERDISMAVCDNLGSLLRASNSKVELLVLDFRRHTAGVRAHRVRYKLVYCVPRPDGTRKLEIEGSVEMTMIDLDPRTIVTAIHAALIKALDANATDMAGLAETARSEHRSVIEDGRVAALAQSAAL